MTQTNHSNRSSPGEPGQDVPWLLNHKVELPDVVAGYMERPDLEERCSSAGTSLLVLQAPGGFGKTAVLAQCGRRLREQGVSVAWLAFDEQDGPARVAGYLALAFERAGIGTIDSAAESRTLDTLARESDSEPGYRITMLIRAIERHGAPCLLALDDVDRLRNPEAVTVLNAFMCGAPRNLRFAMAFRERPPGLDIAMFILEGRGHTIDVEDLRFSNAEMVRFFEARLKRRELAALVENSAGWPIALRLYRNARQTGMPLEQIGGNLETISAWIESRLWRGLSPEDRDFVLDISLFDRIDAALIDEAMGGQHSKRRIDSMQSLNGLLRTTNGGDAALRLHPLIRQYCANRRFRENPDRFVSIHLGIARALARRGHLMDALRHAAEAGDPQLIGEIAECAGGIKLWGERGFDALRALDEWLTAEVISTHPRLALVRCLVLAISGDPDGARSLYRAVATGTAGFTSAPEGTGNEELEREHLLVLGTLLVTGCGELTRYEPLLAGANRLVEPDGSGPMTSGMLCHGYCVLFNEMNEFDRALEWGARARSYLGHNTRHLFPHVDFQAGLAAMAQGRAREAADHYERALKVARGDLLGDATTIMVGEILLAELELERSAGFPGNRPPSAAPSMLVECGAWFDVYAANTDVAVGLALLDDDADAALAIVERVREFARTTGRPALVRYLSALRVSLLVMAGRIDDAVRAWGSDALPVETAACTDLRRLRWREVEAIASARLRLLTACGEFESARDLAVDLRTLATDRRLVRMLMRVLALSMRLEHQAGDSTGAARHVGRYLELFAGTDFIRPLASDRSIALPILDRIVESNRSNSVVDAALAIGGAMKAPDETGEDWRRPKLTRRELEVLTRLQSRADNEIARELKLSYHGVRYRIRCIFAKLGARGRFDALHRARALGILPPETADDRLGP